MDQAGARDPQSLTLAEIRAVMAELIPTGQRAGWSKLITRRHSLAGRWRFLVKFGVVSQFENNPA
jgi:hypothetical protein